MNKWALLAKDANYSLSPLIHQTICRNIRFDGKYDIANHQNASLQHLKTFSAGNITIPFKHDYYQLIAQEGKVDKIAIRDKSVNCFKVINGKIHATSTDQNGIIDTIEKMQLANIGQYRHIIFGDGATGKMIAACLTDTLNVNKHKVFIVSRKLCRLNVAPRIISNDLLAKYLTEDYILYNATPLGMAQQANVSPFSDQIVKGATAVFDTAYTPSFNRLAKQCFEYQIPFQNGLNMLIVQALESFTFWTGADVSCQYANIKREILFASSSKLIVMAMPFAGKSTLHRKYRENSCDLDALVEARVKMPIADYINVYGLSEFRQQEVCCLKQALENDKYKLIFLGGGTLTNSAARELLTDQIVVYMYVQLSSLISRFSQTRANIKSEQELEKIFASRDDLYKNIANFKIGSRNIGRLIDEYLDN